MNYKIAEEKNKVIVKGIQNFELAHIFECGQCFRWNEERDGSFTGVVFGRILNIKKDKNKVIFCNTNLKEFEEIWFNYFDLNTDYSQIKQELSSDPILKEAVKFGTGMRLLKQDPFETLISFIISANNMIPRIKKSIDLISSKYGNYIGKYIGNEYYSFPTPSSLSEASIEELENCKVGFRSKYIANAARVIANKEVDIYSLKNLSTEEARNILMSFKGIGPKVSDCILLFSLQKYDAFPIDVWVKRVMEYFYVKKDTKLKDIQKYAQKKFGKYAGFAQQYLFYYARELKIGKKR